MGFYFLHIIFNTASSAAPQTVPTDAGIEPRTAATGALALGHSTTRLDLIRIRLDLIRIRLDLIRTRLDLIRKLHIRVSDIKIPTNF